MRAWIRVVAEPFLSLALNILRLCAQFRGAGPAIRVIAVAAVGALLLRSPVGLVVTSMACAQRAGGHPLVSTMIGFAALLLLVELVRLAPALLALPSMLAITDLMSDTLARVDTYKSGAKEDD